MRFEFSLKENECISVAFMSRYKDNENVENFKQRSKSFIFDGTKEQLGRKFDRFVNEGLEGELSRCYISLNPRNKESIKMRLISELALDKNINICKLEQKLASLAMSADCKTGKYWLWDFDGSEDQLKEFIEDLELSKCEYEVFETVNNFAVVTSGFDTRKVVEKWKDVAENKKDGYILTNWKVKDMQS